ncbi:MAG: hypothetical protein PHC66_02660 [Candidatus Nanoarchaeia archaeon]|nr:hypothetical protein [Candidatus Nanoarchaeia archaeon]MDD5239674.1 hypothetical protein [Candidatus Nanoarchaeia archaeon]
MSIKSFHISEFPQSKICVLLNKKLRNKILCNKRLVCSLTNKSPSTVSRWLTGTCDRGKSMGPWRKGKQYIPLLNVLTLTRYYKIKINGLEKNIVSYKTIGAGNKFNSPVLPLKETPELFGLITHILCDGSGLPNNTNYYRSYNEKQLDEFAYYIKRCFGDVEITKTPTSIIFPKCICYTISKLYKLKFGTFNGRLPKRLFELPKKFSTLAIRAFIDDEGSIGHSGIRTYSANFKLLNDLKKLIELHHPKIKLSSTYTRSRDQRIEHSFGISPFAFKYFKENIGFTNNKKSADLEFYLSIKERNWNHRPKGVTKNQILKELGNGQHSTKELAKKLDITPKLITYHLSGYTKRGKRIKGLEKLDYVRRQRKGNEIIWSLNECQQCNTE